MLKPLFSEVFQAYASTATSVMGKRFSPADIDRVKKFLNREKILTQLNAMVSFLIPDRSNVKLNLNIGGGSFTDGKSITVGLPHIFIKSSYEEIFTILQALTGHEAQHINSSDFEAYTAYQKDIADLFVSKYKHMNENILRQYMSKIAVAFGNGVEDGRIEKILGAKFAGYIKYLKFMNGSMWNAQDIKGNSELEDFLYCIVSYSVTGLDPKGFNKVWKGTELEENYYKLKPMIMNGINSTSCRLCLSYCKDMIGMVEPYLVKLLEQRTKEDEEFLNNLPDKPEFTTSSEVDYNTNPSVSTHFKPEKKQQDKKEKEKQKEDNKDQEGKEEQKKQKSSSNNKEDQKEENKQDSKSKKEQEDASKEEQDGKGSTSEAEKPEEDQKKSSGGDSDDEKDEEDPESDENGSGKSSDKEDETDKDEESDGKSNGSSGDKGDDEDNSDDESDDDDSDGEGDNKGDSDKDADSDSDSDSDNNSDKEQQPGDGDKYDDNLNPAEQIPDEDLVKGAMEELIQDIEEDVKDKVADEPMNTAKKSEQKTEDDSKLTDQELEEIKNLYKNDVAKNFSEERGFSLRHSLPDHIKSKANRFRKEMERIFKNKEMLTLRGQKRGVLDASNLWKLGVKETNVFVKRGTPIISDYVGYILWDGSGSMGSDDKQTHSGYAVSVAEEGLKGLIPFKVTQFSVNNRGVVHHVVKDFKENSQMNYGYNYLFHRRAGGGNKDGYSIRVATAELMKRPEKDRILIIFSDGLPSDYSGGEKAGMADVKQAVKEARSKGIFVVSLIFGTETHRDFNMENYKYMYEKNIISCSPSEIQNQLVKLLKKVLAR